MGEETRNAAGAERTAKRVLTRTSGGNEKKFRIPETLRRKYVFGPYLAVSNFKKQSTLWDMVLNGRFHVDRGQP